MKTSRRIKILIESERVFVITRRVRAIASRCENCGCDVEVTTPEAASIIVSLSLREIFQMVGADKLHFFETTEVKET